MKQRSGHPPGFAREWQGYKQNGKIVQYFELDTSRDYQYGYKEHPLLTYVREVASAGYDSRLRCDVCPKQGRSPVYIIESYKGLRLDATCGHRGCLDHTPNFIQRQKELLQQHFDQNHTQEELDQFTAMQVLTRS